MKTLLTSLAIIYTFFSKAQLQENKQFKHDIALSAGMSLGNSNFARYGVISRRTLTASWKLKFSGYFDRSFSSNSKNYDPIFTSDTIVIIRNYETASNRFIFKSGFDRSFFKFFVAGSDFNLGYASNNNITVDRGSKYNSGIQQWQDCNECVYEYHNESPSENYQIDQSQSIGYPDYVRKNKGENYLLYGISMNVGVRFSINHRWEFALHYSPELMRYQSFSQAPSFNRFQHFSDLILRLSI